MNNQLSFAENLARQTGKLLLQYYNQANFSARLKSDKTVVTEADLAADRLITDSIHQAFPEDGLVSEELQPVSPRDVSRVWVVDPLDGTTNFSLGIPFWGVSIALLVDGWPETAALYFPVLEEMYIAQKGKGARYNDTPLLMDPTMQNRLGTFFACCSRTHRRYNVSIPYKPRILGSAAYNFCILARGIARLAFEAAPKIWDIAGAWLVVSESQAVIQPLNGSMPFPILPLTEYRKQNYPTLAAISAELEITALSQIQPKPHNGSSELIQTNRSSGN
jgi:myo-inositol-1(or 4)-monophosphatase